jgi:hypothetical protein
MYNVCETRCIQNIRAGAVADGLNGAIVVDWPPHAFTHLRFMQLPLIVSKYILPAHCLFHVNPPAQE